MMMTQQTKLMCCNMCWGAEEPVLFNVDRDKVDVVTGDGETRAKQVYKLRPAVPEGNLHICLGCLTALQLIPEEAIEDLVKQLGHDMPTLLEKISLIV